jgi:hypothetical protein
MNSKMEKKMKTAKEIANKYCICPPQFKSAGTTAPNCCCAIIESVVEEVRKEIADEKDVPEPKAKAKKTK